MSNQELVYARYLFFSSSIFVDFPVNHARATGPILTFDSGDFNLKIKDEIVSNLGQSSVCFLYFSLSEENSLPLIKRSKFVRCNIKIAVLILQIAQKVGVWKSKPSIRDSKT